MTKRLKKIISVHISALAAVAVYYALPIVCPIKYFFHINCPTCGMTRAILSLLKGNLRAYAEYNPAALPFLILLLFGFHRRLFPISRKAGDIILAAGAGCVLIVYILRIILVNFDAEIL